jgi:hypothetical protein
MYGSQGGRLIDVDNGNDKSWSSSFSLPSCCLRGEGFEDEFSDNSDLLKAVRRVFNPNAS